MEKFKKYFVIASLAVFISLWSCLVVFLLVKALLIDQKCPIYKNQQLKPQENERTNKKPLYK